MTEAPPVPRAWTLWAILPLLGVAAMVALVLATTHLMLTHGVPDPGGLAVCEGGGGVSCDAVSTSRYSELFGVPLSLWTLPLYGAMAWLAVSGTRDSERGARARGALVGVAGVAVAVSAVLLAIMAFEIQAWCGLCLSLDAVHVVVLVLALLPPKGRRLALPARGDALGVAIVLLNLTLAAWWAATFMERRLESATQALLFDATALAHHAATRAHGAHLGALD